MTCKCAEIRAENERNETAKYRLIAQVADLLDENERLKTCLLDANESEAKLEADIKAIEALSDSRFDENERMRKALEDFVKMEEMGEFTEGGNGARAFLHIAKQTLEGREG